MRLPDSGSDVVLALAPMEGLADFHLRQLITAQEGYDYCVTEFIRVTNQVYPRHKFISQCPELLNNCATKSATPVHVQLLGSEPELMAKNAYKAHRLGAQVIDINYGCPAKTVNRHKGGACLLLNPQNLYDITRAVREFLPQSVKVSAKMRLGYHDKALCVDNAQALEAAGASWITIHARTKDEGYQPPAHWEYIAKVKQHIAIPVVANGDIWSVQDFIRCREVTDCNAFMIGRGAVRNPLLALQIRQSLKGVNTSELDWLTIKPLIMQYIELLNTSDNPRHQTGRLKQWLSFLKQVSPEALSLFEHIKRLKDLPSITRVLQAF